MVTRTVSLSDIKFSAVKWFTNLPSHIRYELREEYGIIYYDENGVYTIEFLKFLVSKYTEFLRKIKLDII